MEKTIFVEIIEFTDPACTWCWGSEPILRKLENHYKENIEINFIMGGLVQDIRNFRDTSNGIGGNINTVNEEVAKHWLEASNRHGMPVDAKNFSLFSSEYYSTYPMNIAYKAAQMEDKKLAKKFLRRIREAVSAEGKQTNRIEILIELAQESGLNIPLFIQNFTDGSAEEAFMDDLYTTKTYRANGFPTFLVRASNGKEIMLRGYQSYETFNQVIKQITDGNIDEIKVEANEQTILDFIGRYGRVAPAEIEMAFNVSKSEVKSYLEKFQSQNKINIDLLGNGSFISIKHDNLSCDSQNGLCYM